MKTDQGQKVDKLGGIDLTNDIPNIKTKDEQINFSQMANIENFDPTTFNGFKPVIFTIQPLNFSAFAGMK